jgi:hypothetical protein
MTPTEFEDFVADFFIQEGFSVERTPQSGDYGVDVFAIKGREKLAVQVKMYGSSTRGVNRAAIMELHGAKDFFDCTKAILATDGSVRDDAQKVAAKLGIDILYLKDLPSPGESSKKSNSSNLFDEIWKKHIIPLEGKKLHRSDDESNEILKVDWGGIERLTSNGRKQKIGIEIFKFAVNKLLQDGFVSRDEINQNYTGRASSGIILILSQVPEFEMTSRPKGLKRISGG